jgi:peptide/nickel transport system ATP-binding protein
MTLLSVQGLRLALGGREILAGVDLAIAAGTVTGLVGASGSGKSLAALAIMGLAPEGAATGGSVRLGGREMQGAPEADLCRIRGRDIAMIFQEPLTALDPLRTIGDQVAETLLIHRACPRPEARARAGAMLARVGLPPERVPPGRYPHELSGGQRQRVAIAMAVALRPRLLIADEPTTALDVVTQAQILGLMRGFVAAEGMALLLISHDLAVVAGIADRVAVMSEGRIVEEGPARALIAQPAHAATRALVAAATHRPARAAPPAPGPDAAPLLACREVSRSYPLPRPHPFAARPRLLALDRVSLALARGESLGIVGASGSGKSTLGRAVLGLDPIDGGEITLGGVRVDPARMPQALRARMQAVFQDPYASFDPRQSVGRLVAEPFHLAPDVPAAERRDRVAEALRDVGLSPDDAGRRIHAFSGGQRQRIALARALVLRPDLIVLDEAVSALDPAVRARILDLLAALQARHGLAYLFIGHDLEVVGAITDRVIVLEAGRIVETGPTARLLAAPAHPHTQALVAAVPRLPR